jgi:8-hydroxy-5-deazaflavin:NADPH oxidoreductase
MRIAVLGSGNVGRTVAAGLSKAGHDVVLGSRETSRPEVAQWSSDTGVRVAEPAEAGRHGEVLVNATPGVASAEALAGAGCHDRDGTVVLDLANPLDFSAGFPPSLTVANTDSLAESLQRQFPRLRVVKALNTVTPAVMVDPGQLAEPTALFVAGDDADAKATVAGMLASLGWDREQIFDVGGLSAARGTEAYVLLWVRLMQALGTADFNIRVVRAAG